jgi:DNA-binding response OmpR family regulator
MADPNRWDSWRDSDKLALPVILLVEDDPDIREMMCTLLDLADFAVVACDTAERGLDALREQSFDLVLTDYALPTHTGLWLLETAEAEGLLQDTPVLVVTAHPEVKACPYEIIQKPFDLDELVDRVRQRLEGDRGGIPRRAAAAPPQSRGSSGGASGCPDPVELILYVDANSPKADAAVSQMQRVLERFNSRKVKVTVCPLPESAKCAVAEAPPGATAPIRRQVSARTLILGHITHPEILLELLTDCDIEQ